MKNINIKVEDELHAAIKMLAAGSGKKLSEVVTEALKTYAEANL